MSSETEREVPLSRPADLVLSLAPIESESARKSEATSSAERSIAVPMWSVGWDQSTRGRAGGQAGRRTGGQYIPAIISTLDMHPRSILLLLAVLSACPSARLSAQARDFVLR